VVNICISKFVLFMQVSPPYDRSGATANMAANLLYEMLCVLPGVKYYKLQ